MKLLKTTFILGLILLSAVSYGQRRGSNSTELGIRVASGWGNFAIDGAFPMSSTRLHADLGFGQNWIGTDFLFDFMFPIQDVDGLYVYAGPGFGIGLSFYDYYDYNRNVHYEGSDVHASLLGEVGIEYKVPQVPFTFGLDIRPAIHVVPNFGTNVYAGLNIRYRF